MSTSFIPREPIQARRSSRLFAIAIALTVAGQAHGAAAAHAGAPQEAEDPVLQISVAPGLEGADRIRRGVEEQGSEQLDILRVNSAFEPNDPKRILVEVGGADYEYSIRVTATRDGKTPLGSAIVSGCKCSETELVRAVLKELPEAVDRFDSEDASPTPAGEDPEATPRARDDEPAALVDTGERGKAVGPVGWVGILGIAAGAGLLVGGGVLLPKEESTGMQLEPGTTTYQTSAIGLLASGGVVLVAGVAALVVDQTVLKKKRRLNSRASVSPSIGKTGAGLHVTGRF